MFHLCAQAEVHGCAKMVEGIHNNLYRRQSVL